MDSSNVGYVKESIPLNLLKERYVISNTQE